jgi:beta-N-acetylhexosaminidase
MGVGSQRSTLFKSFLENRIGKINSLLFTKSSKRHQYNQSINELKKSDLIILTTFIDVKTYRGPVDLSAEQIDFISNILRLKIPTILISFRNPYLASLFPNASVILNTFSHSKASQQAVMRAILGETDIIGSLPVTVPETNFAYGYGLTIPKSISTVLELDLLSNSSYPLIDKTINEAIAERLFPGAVVSFGRKGKLMYNKAFGKSGFGEVSYILKTDDVFDIGNAARNVAVLPALLKLFDQELLKPEDKVHRYFKDFYSYDKKDITIEHLISHSSGLGGKFERLNSNWNRDELMYSISTQALQYKTGTDVVVSPVNDVILQMIIEKISGKTIDEFLIEHIISGLELKNTKYYSYYNSENILFPFSGIKKKDYISQKVHHKELTSILNGFTPLQGLYSNTIELAIFSQMLLQKGYYDGNQIINANSVTQFNKNFKTIDGSGCALWIDEEEELFIIVLSDTGVKNASNAGFLEFFNKIKNLIYSKITMKEKYD